MSDETPVVSLAIFENGMMGFQHRTDTANEAMSMLASALMQLKNDLPCDCGRDHSGSGLILPPTGAGVMQVLLGPDGMPFVSGTPGGPSTEVLAQQMHDVSGKLLRGERIDMRTPDV